MKKQTWAFRAALVISTALWGGLSGCSQPDNPTPVTAPPAPPPKPEELVVPKEKASGKEYGANAKYQKAMQRVHKGGQ